MGTRFVSATAVGYASCRSTHRRTEASVSRAAALALAQLVRPGTRVLVARDPALDGRDGYGRLLRYVFVERTLVNLELVRRGAAMPYFFHRERGLFAADLMDSAEDARDARRGLWAACPRAKLDPNRRSLTGPG